MSAPSLFDLDEMRDEPGISALKKWRALSSKALIWQDRMEVLRLAASLQHFFDDEATLHKQQIAQFRRPAMMMYMNDGWSAFTWKVELRDLGGRKQRSCQKVRVEYLVERSIIKSLHGAGVSMSMQFGAPRPLSHGRSAWDVFGATVEWSEPLRASTNGPVWNIYCWDGHLFQPLRRLAFARHLLYYKTRLLCFLSWKKM